MGFRRRFGLSQIYNSPYRKPHFILLEYVGLMHASFASMNPRCPMGLCLGVVVRTCRDLLKGRLCSVGLIEAKR